MSGSHSAYHEAKRRAALPQPAVRHKLAASLLLLAPNNIIFDLFDTIIRKTSSDLLMQYITSNFKDYLEHNWTNRITQRLVGRLQKEQALDRKAGLLDIPSLRAARPSLLAGGGGGSKEKSERKYSSDESQKSQRTSEPKRSSPRLESNVRRELAIKQIYEHIIWRISTGNVTQTTTLMLKLALDDGYKRAKLKAELYSDVATNFQNWRSELLIKIYAFGDAPPNDQKLLLANTTEGDLTKWIANFIDGTEKRQNPDLLRKLASALRDKLKNCIYITNSLEDANAAIQTNSIRCVFVVDRLDLYENLEGLMVRNKQLKSLLEDGKLFLMTSLNCVQFAPDPTSLACC